MDSHVLLIPSVSSLPTMKPEVNRNRSLPDSFSLIVKQPNQYKNDRDRKSSGSGEGSCIGGNKQKYKTKSELILVMEPQNPSPTKYFDQNGVPLKKEVLDSNELPEQTAKSSKKRTKLTITCHKCAKQFETKIEYEFHYRKSYNQEPIYACTTCDKRITQYKAYRLHSYRHSHSANQRYTCATCSKVFHQRSDLSRHESIHETQSQEPELAAAPNAVQEKLCCDRCDAAFDSQAEMRVHVKKNHPIPKQMIECPDCGKFLSAGSLYSHRKIHSDGPKFTCEDCDKSFVQKINFIHHRKKHLPNDERPFPCGMCGKAFFERSHLQRHQFFHSEERPFKCGLCGKCYKTERCLKVHSAVHNADRPFVCVECNKGFLSSSKLRQHSNIHSGLRPFKCKYCSRDFTNFPNWLKHIRRRHKVDHRTGEKLDSVPKFMTKKKNKSDNKKLEPGKEGKIKLKKPSSKEILQLSIKEESLPFVGDNSNIDLNLVSKDDLLQPLKMEEMDDIFLELPASCAGDDDAGNENACDVIPKKQEEVEQNADVECNNAQDSEQLEAPPSEHDIIDPPPLGLAGDDSELFQFGYVQPEFDCDFSIKNDFSLRTEAVNVIRESESGMSSPPDGFSSPTTGALVYDINSELPIFPTLISICGDEQQFQLINPNFIHLPQLRRTAPSSGASGTNGVDVVGLKIESP
ncbi:zinc finger protein 578-like [Malaya genurostris]|uniref:zinc finger protein 578-like n=1 Tax=Malaya genurostris TaxID=325434 RepID=UPI0026F3FE6B|nr:zinc finger protein 578-like [Malaya genurostris]